MLAGLQILFLFSSKNKLYDQMNACIPEINQSGKERQKTKEYLSVDFLNFNAYQGQTNLHL